MILSRLLLFLGLEDDLAAVNAEYNSRRRPCQKAAIKAGGPQKFHHL